MQSEDAAEGGKAAKAEEEGTPSDAGHRVLVFAQLKALLDCVEADLLQPAGIPFLRLDGRFVQRCFEKSSDSCSHGCTMPCTVQWATGWGL